jgi:transcriptional regulator with XRE-family HTH domain
MIDWSKRRRNIRVLCADRGLSPTKVAEAIDLSPNTLTKFLNSDDPERGLSNRTLILILDYFGLSDVTDLDAENPLGDPRISLRRIISELSPEEALALHRELRARFKSPS